MDDHDLNWNVEESECAGDVNGIRNIPEDDVCTPRDVVTAKSKYHAAHSVESFSHWLRHCATHCLGSAALMCGVVHDVRRHADEPFTYSVAMHTIHKLKKRAIAAVMKPTHRIAAYLVLPLQPLSTESATSSSSSSLITMLSLWFTTYCSHFKELLLDRSLGRTRFHCHCLSCSRGMTSNANEAEASGADSAVRTSGHIPLWRVLFVIANCIVYIAVLASFIISLCGYLVSLLGLHSSTVGATIVAMGSEVLCRQIINSLDASHSMYMHHLLSFPTQ